MEVKESPAAKRIRQDTQEEGEIPGDLAEAMDLPSSFGSTKNCHVQDNSKTAARGGRAPKQTRKARQYMNLKKPKKQQE